MTDHVILRNFVSYVFISVELIITMNKSSLYERKLLQLILQCFRDIVGVTQADFTVHYLEINE